MSTGTRETPRIQIESTTAEKIPIVVTTRLDPSATPPDFSITLAAVTDPDTWTPGTWSSAYTVANRINALSPLVGAGQTLDIDEATDHKLWIRWTNSDGETVVRLAAILLVN